MSEPMIDWLYGLQHFGIKLGLDNIRQLLRLLGQPQHGLRCAHIGGTNGKGSVAAMLDTMLLASAVPSGLFTSPHLMRPNERIRIAGNDISGDELDRLLVRLRTLIEQALRQGVLEAHPSFFEVITATALQAFRDHGLEAAVLEVGLGGRLDATNAVDADVGVVVSIGLDHTKTLGSTLAAIAGEKAGIIKAGQRFVNGVVQPEALEVLRRVAREREATWIEARLATRLAGEGERGLTFETDRARYGDLRIALPGRHQIDNARIALTVYEQMMERLGREVQVDAVRDALARVRWPGRLQWIEARPGRPAYLLDGAHNAEGMRTLVDYLDRRGGPRPVLLFGATHGKPVEQLLGALEGRVDAVVLTLPPVDKGIDPAEIEPIAAELFDAVDVVPQVEPALARCAGLAGTLRPVLITGSLYLVGSALALIERRDVPGPVSL